MQMKTKSLFLSTLFAIFSITAIGQLPPHYQWTLLDEGIMDEIIGETSGETAFHHILEMGAYNRNRPASEYSTTLWEAEYVMQKLKEYGLPGAKIERFEGRQTWDGIKGELWEISPGKKKIADYDDIRGMLASGSTNTDVKAELIWIREGTPSDLAGLDLQGKIVVTSASAGRVHDIVVEKGAVGVISFDAPRPLVDPIQIPSTGIRSRSGNATFAFLLPPREGHLLRTRLTRGEKIQVHAVVEAEMQDLDLQVPTCVIPGTDPNAGEIIFSAHLFEGYTKQGANDNISGSSSILEVARTLYTLMEEGRIPRTKRNIRFIWVPEFSGTIPWVKEHADLMEETLCNINLDMVGLWLSKSQSSFNLERTTYGNAHYINDVMENYFRYVGETNRVSLVLSGRGGYVNRIVAPSGSDEPFYYAIEAHYGSSDHEVFNDWAVGVPGVMLITWPDNYYHTSEDRPDKCDPTQMKRCSIIAAASAYTIALAEEDMASQIVGEVLSNGIKRMSYQLQKGLDELGKAGKDDFTKLYKKTRAYTEAAMLNEIATLETVLELAPNDKQLEVYVQEQSEVLTQMASSQFKAIDALMKNRAGALGLSPVSLKPTSLEKKAMGIVLNVTEKVRESGYRGYSSLIPRQSRPEPGAGRVADTGEMQRLCNGRYNLLEIKKLLDTQSSRESDLQAIIDYADLLKSAGLVR